MEAWSLLGGGEVAVQGVWGRRRNESFQVGHACLLLRPRVLTPRWKVSPWAEMG